MHYLLRQGVLPVGCHCDDVRAAARRAPRDHVLEPLTADHNARAADRALYSTCPTYAPCGCTASLLSRFYGHMNALGGHTSRCDYQAPMAIDAFSCSMPVGTIFICCIHNREARFGWSRQCGKYRAWGRYRSQQPCRVPAVLACSVRGRAGASAQWDLSVEIRIWLRGDGAGKEAAVETRWIIGRWVVSLPSTRA